MNMEIGTKVTVTPKNGDAYTGYVRSVHESGYTIWMDADAKDEGEVRTIHTSGPWADSDIAAAKE